MTSTAYKEEAASGRMVSTFRSYLLEEDPTKLMKLRTKRVLIMTINLETSSKTRLLKISFKGVLKMLIGVITIISMSRIESGRE